jgi:hypothetical protein
MATLPWMRPVREVTLGLALAGALFVGPALLTESTPSAFASNGIAAFEEPPPPPDPVPIIDKPLNPGAGNNNEAPQMRHRRHRGDPVMGR